MRPGYNPRHFRIKTLMSIDFLRNSENNSPSKRETRIETPRRFTSSEYQGNSARSLMKRSLSVSITAVLLFVMTGISGFASQTVFTPPSSLRVGLSSKYGGVGTLSISNGSIICGYEQNGYFFSECSLYSQSGFSASAASGYYVKTGTFNGYNDARNYADNLNRMGYTAAPCAVSPGGWVVYAGPYNSEQQAYGAAPGLYGTVVAPGGKAVLLKSGGEVLLMFDSQLSSPQIADAGGGAVSLGDRKYRGRIELYRGSAGITAVNVVTLEEYLYGAVPSESASSWNAEALKAQAVASRSYIVNRMGNHSSSGYDVCDGTHCHVYNGAGNEADSTTAAVNATRGVYVYYDGKPISAVFFSSSGGVTDNSENVWTYSLSYLKSVAEVNETTGKVWERTFTLEEIDRALAANGANIGKAVGVTIAKVENGRVQELVINGTNGSKSLFKEEIRTFFSSLTGGSLESRNFAIADGTLTQSGSNVFATNGYTTEQLPVDFYITGADGPLGHSSDVSGTVSAVSSSSAVASYSAESSQVTSGYNSNSITFKGKGLGHGVGMSQHGAQGMAQMGYTYEQILKWYYTGVEVR